MADLIDRSRIPTIRIEIPGLLDNRTIGIFEGTVKAVRQAINMLPSVDAVPREQHEALLRRFQHLLESDYIRSFDEVDPRTGTYKRDISEAVAPVDKIVCCKDCVHYDNTPYDWMGARYCERLGLYRPANFYCALAKAILKGEKTE